MRRPTIADVAARAGVTKAAVSFALNGQPGVSESTRVRILAAATDLGFHRSSAARALSAGRAGAFGLVIDRPASTLAAEPYFMQLIAGIQAELSAAHVALLFTTAEDQTAEVELYRTWWAQRRVDGVFLVDLRVRDRRIPALRELAMPAVVFGSPRGSGHLPAIWPDERAATRLVVEHLAALGHRRIARVGGVPRYWHTRLRSAAVQLAAAEAGIAAVSVDGDYSGEHAARATETLLTGGAPPTAILYDSDLMAIAGLSAAARLGVDVPSALSVVAWDDSVLCELVHPAVTALYRDVAAIGATGARLLAAAASGAEARSSAEPDPVLTVRASSGPAPRSAPSRSLKTIS